jgi:hypothetical protein
VTTSTCLRTDQHDTARASPTLQLLPVAPFCMRILCIYCAHDMLLSHRTIHKTMQATDLVRYSSHDQSTPATNLSYPSQHLFRKKSMHVACRSHMHLHVRTVSTLWLGPCLTNMLRLLPFFKMPILPSLLNLEHAAPEPRMVLLRCYRTRSRTSRTYCPCD